MLPLSLRELLPNITDENIHQETWTGPVVGNEVVLLRARMPGVEIPEMADLLEVKTVLANRVVEWTQEWEQQGAEKTLRKTLAQARSVLVRHLEARFGPLSESVQCRLETIDSVETLMELMSRVPQARSLDELGLK